MTKANKNGCTKNTQDNEDKNISQIPKMKMEPNAHPQVVIRHGDWGAYVDEGIADLILAMWKADIYTFLSCEKQTKAIDDCLRSYGNVTWISLEAVSFDHFMNCLFAGGVRDNLFYRAMGEDTIDGCDLPPWKYSTTLSDLAEVLNKDNEIVCDGAPHIETGISVRFPVEDYPKVLKRMKDYNVAREEMKERKEAEAVEKSMNKK